MMKGCLNCGAAFEKASYPQRCPICGSKRIGVLETGPENPDFQIPIPQDVLEKFFTDNPPKPSGRAVDQEHYNATDLQPIEVMQRILPPEQFVGFLRGNVIKYSLRAGRKDEQRREVDKAIQYAKWWREALDGKTIDPRGSQ